MEAISQSKENSSTSKNEKTGHNETLKPKERVMRPRRKNETQLDRIKKAEKRDSETKEQNQPKKLSRQTILFKRIDIKRSIKKSTTINKEIVKIINVTNTTEETKTSQVLNLNLKALLQVRVSLKSCLMATDS